MPTSTNGKSDGIPVKTTLKTGELGRGMLHYGKEGPVLKQDSGGILEDTEGVKFSFIENSRIIQLSHINSDTQITLKPEAIVKMRYSPNQTNRFEMYPPSTDGWLSHVVDTGEESVFAIQRINGNNKRLLTIVNRFTLELYHIGMIQQYEPSILTMNRDWDMHDEILYSDVKDVDIFDIFKKDSISRTALSKLVEGIALHKLTIGKTMKETLDQLVPHSFKPNIRNQIMAFLGGLEEADIPKEDPIDFVMKNRSVDVYRELAWGHLQCLLDNVDPPQYVRLLHMADKGQLEIASRPQPEVVEKNPWTMVSLKLHDLFPDWTGRVIDYAIALENSGKIVTNIPVSKSEAKKSKRAWSDRFAIANNMMFMRGHVHKESFGLVPAIYIGGAHKWPHSHLEWSARLGYSSEKPQYIQVMVMPPSSFERVSRILPTIRSIDWEMSSMNLSLYNRADRKWKINKSLITKSLERKRSINQLANEFGRWNGKNLYHITKKRARILDLISWGMYLSSLETGRYSRYYGLSNSSIKQELDAMHDHGVFILQYFFIPANLRSLCILANGPSEKICSMSRAFLKHAPSAHVRLTNAGTSCVIVSRVPDDEFYEFVSTLTETASENGVSLQAYPISAYAGYRNNVYSRLMNNDGSWNDDVSGLLSQVRLRSKSVDD